MEFDKNKFLEYLKEEKKSNNNLKYLYNLYKTYDLTESIIKKQGNEGKQFIQKQEDEIYNIKNKPLTEKQKIEYELVNIGKKIKLNDINNTNEINALYDEYLDLLIYTKDNNLNDSMNIEYIKKQISILQAKLGLKNTFFLSAHDSFLELYRNVYLSMEDRYIEKKGK